MVVRKLTLCGSLLVLSAALLPLSACGFTDDGDYAVIPSWLINGLAPDEALCAEYGIDRIEFRVLSGRHTRTLTGNCEEAIEFDDGDQYGGFITTRSFDYGRTYDYEIRLLDAQGRALQNGTVQSSFRAYASDWVPYLLDPVEVYAPEGTVASLVGTWDLVGGYASCATLGIDRVAVVVASRVDPDFTYAHEIASAPCEDGIVRSPSPVLAYGDYYVRYEAVSANDAIIDESAAMRVVVDREGEVALEPARFDGY